MIWSKALVVSIVWAIQRAAGAPYEPTIGPEILDMTSSSLLDHDRINASHPVSFRKRACPTGTTYTSLKDPFTSFDSEFWSIESGQGGLAYKTDGLHLTIDANIVSLGSEDPHTRRTPYVRASLIRYSRFHRPSLEALYCRVLASGALRFTSAYGSVRARYPGSSTRSS